MRKYLAMKHCTRFRIMVCDWACDFNFKWYD